MLSLPFVFWGVCVCVCVCVGLQRCGKSCRLRWTNYLRPDIKRGKFNLQEEQSIIQLHALLGNRWDGSSSRWYIGSWNWRSHSHICGLISWFPLWCYYSFDDLWFPDFVSALRSGKAHDGVNALKIILLKFEKKKLFQINFYTYF